MRLTDILVPEAVAVPLEAADKQQAISALSKMLADVVGFENHDELRNAVWRREQTRTTGIGHGVAIPHGKIKGIEKLCMAVGRLASPIPFDAIDGKPVDLIFLLASPEDQTGPHIQSLAAVSRLLTEPDTRNALKRATDADALYRIISEHEAAQVGG